MIDREFHNAGVRFSTVMHVALAVVLAGCSGGEDGRRSAGDTTRTAAAETLRVALLTPGPISDRSWNWSAHEGLGWIRDSLGARTSHIQTKTPAEFEENFRQYGTQGYDLVFGHGFEFQDAAVRVAPSFPKTQYVVTSGSTVRENVSGIRFGFEDASYLAGLLAGTVTKTGTIGMIGGAELPPVKSSFDAFTAGARAARPDVKVIASYLGTWDDVSAGKEQALAQIARGADIIFQNADAAGLGIFQAVRESRGVRAFGSNANQNAVAPEIILGSVVIDVPRAMLLVAREVSAGTFKPRVVRVGAPSDVVRLVLNPQLEHEIPARGRALVDSVHTRMVRDGFTLAPEGVERAGGVR